MTKPQRKALVMLLITLTASTQELIMEHGYRAAAFFVFALVLAWLFVGTE